MKRNNKGITLITVVVTIVIILILTSVIITNTYTGDDYKRYKLMCADIDLLEDKILLYYNQYQELPTIGEAISDIPEEIHNNNGHTFYEIDVKKLNNVTLNYGDDEDIYIIDTTTFEVYFKNGIEYDGEMHYTY